MHRIKMRLSGTPDDLDKWLTFLKRVEGKGLIELMEVGEKYANTRKGESKYFRQYLEIELLVDPHR